MQWEIPLEEESKNNPVKKMKKLVKPLLEGYDFGLRMACIVWLHQSILR